MVIIESRDANIEDVDSNWEHWSECEDSDVFDLLSEFVAAVSCEEIDDVNRYWRVRRS